MLTDADRALLRGRAVAHLATLNIDGTPQTTPVWIDLDEEDLVLVNTAVGRTKDRNLRRDPRAALSITPVENAYRWVSINGTVAEVIEGPRAEAHIDELSRRYTGKAWDPVEGQVRVLFRIRPEKVLRSG